MTNLVKIIVAGQGVLPIQIMRHCQPCHAILLHGIAYADEWQAIPHIKLHLGELGKLCQLITKIDAKIAIMAGDIRRPSLNEIKHIDTMGKEFLKQNAMAFLKGDDGLLKLLTNFITDKTGVEWQSPNQALQIQRKIGLWAGKKPSPEQIKSAQYGQEILKTLSPFDIGQAIIMQQNLVLGIEACEGTQGLINRMGGLIKNGEKPIMVKNCKSGQSMALDLPTLGLESLKSMQEIGIAGVFFTHLGNLMQEAECEKFCQDHDFFIYLI